MNPLDLLKALLKVNVVANKVSNKGTYLLYNGVVFFTCLEEDNEYYDECDIGCHYGFITKDLDKLGFLNDYPIIMHSSIINKYKDKKSPRDFITDIYAEDGFIKMKFEREDETIIDGFKIADENHHLIKEFFNMKEAIEELKPRYKKEEIFDLPFETLKKISNSERPVIIKTNMGRVRVMKSLLRSPTKDNKGTMRIVPLKKSSDVFLNIISIDRSKIFTSFHVYLMVKY